jgi:hypothetical protein
MATKPKLTDSIFLVPVGADKVRDWHARTGDYAIKQRTRHPLPVKSGKEGLWGSPLPPKPFSSKKQNGKYGKGVAAEHGRQQKSQWIHHTSLKETMLFCMFRRNVSGSF